MSVLLQPETGALYELSPSDPDTRDEYSQATAQPFSNLKKGKKRGNRPSQARPYLPRLFFIFEPTD
jgi:hypothetical protein